MAQIITPKIISDPVWGIFDIRPVLPIIDTPQFQSLQEKHQLGLLYWVYRSANHTRFEHSLGTYAATRKLARFWLDAGFITPQESELMCVYALLHDIGHPAFSHLLEALCPTDNNGLGLALLDEPELRKALSLCGIDSILLKQLFSETNPLSRAVHDQNLGTDKIDYLRRDGRLTIRSEPESIDMIMLGTYWLDHDLVIDQSIVDAVGALQGFYRRMYSIVYMSDTSINAGRMLQKMVFELVRSGELALADIPRIPEWLLRAKLYISTNTLVRTLFERLEKRYLFKDAIVLLRDDKAHLYRVVGKAIRVFPLAPEVMERFVSFSERNFRNLEFLRNIELHLATMTGIPFDSLLIVPTPSLLLKRFHGKDIKIHLSSKTLMESNQENFKAFEEMGHTKTLFKVCTTDTYRHLLSSEKIAHVVFDYLQSHI